MPRAAVTCKPGAASPILPDRLGSVQNERGREAALRFQKTARKFGCRRSGLNSILLLKGSESTSRQLLAVIPYSSQPRSISHLPWWDCSLSCDISKISRPQWMLFSSESYAVSLSIKLNKAFTGVGNGTQVSLTHITEQQRLSQAPL